MRLKIGESKSRGYCGWHTTWDSKEVFLRSLNEYVVACMLDANCIPYLTEKMVFKVDGVGYKPDFFLYSDCSYNHVYKIIEVKHQGDREAHDMYMNLYFDLFKKMGIEYEVIYRFDALKTKYCSKEMQNQWREYSKETTQSQAVCGENNPMFGHKHTNETKRLIGEKASKRFEDEVYRNNQKEKISAFYTTEEGKRFKEYLRDLRHKEKEERDRAYQALPDIIKECRCCKKVMVSKEGYDICSNKCKRTLKRQEDSSYGKHSNKELGNFKRFWSYLNIIASSYKISFEELIEGLDKYVALAKHDGVLSKNKGMSKTTLIKHKVIEETIDGKIKINYPK